MSGWGLRTQPPWMERVGAGPGKGGARQNGGTPAGMQGQDIEREVAENAGPLLSERLDRVPTLPPHSLFDPGQVTQPLRGAVPFFV